MKLPRIIALVGIAAFVGLPAFAAEPVIVTVARADDKYVRHSEGTAAELKARLDAPPAPAAKPVIPAKDVLANQMSPAQRAALFLQLPTDVQVALLDAAR